MEGKLEGRRVGRDGLVPPFADWDSGAMDDHFSNPAVKKKNVRIAEPQRRPLDSNEEGWLPGGEVVSPNPTTFLEGFCTAVRLLFFFWGYLGS